MIYNVFLWAHIIAIIAWMAGLLYLPRLFVYHAEAEAGGELDCVFQKMEERLSKIIMMPSLLASWLFGFLLVIKGGYWLSGWFWVKFLLVLLLVLFHIRLAIWRKAFASGVNKHDSRFYRRINEIPTVLMMGIVFFVVFKPF